MQFLHYKWFCIWIFWNLCHLDPLGRLCIFFRSSVVFLIVLHSPSWVERFLFCYSPLLYKSFVVQKQHGLVFFMAENSILYMYLDHVSNLLICHFQTQFSYNMSGTTGSKYNSELLVCNTYLTSLWLIVPELSLSNILNASSISSSDTCVKEIDYFWYLGCGSVSWLSELFRLDFQWKWKMS